MIDVTRHLCHGSGVRRFVAGLVLLALMGVIAAPALASCRMPADECCCDPAPVNALCAPDCCDTVGRAHVAFDASTAFRATPLIADAVTAPPSDVDFLVRALPRLAPRLLVALHERAGPRLPLRV